MPAYSRLTYEKRYTIEAMIRKGSSPPEIAAAIGVCQTTVSRELNRNGMNRDTYSATAAEEHAESCRRRSGSPISPELRAEVESRLRTEQWSPEQISAVLKREGTGSVSHETIDQYIYADKRSGGSLHRHLRHKCKSYRKRGSGRERRGRIRNQVMIDQRPPEAENRFRLRTAILPDQEQWLSLWDDDGARVFTGKCYRTSTLTGRMDFVVQNVFKQLLNAPFIGSGGRAYQVYPTQDLAITLRDILTRAQASGLPIQPPETFPALYVVPKMALKQKSYGEALITVLKYTPDVGTRMDYTTSPPTLRFIRRTSTPAKRIDIDVSGHGLLSSTRLEPKPWLRALGVSFQYALRQDAYSYIESTQSAGDPDAEKSRQIALVLSGFENADALTRETLSTALASLHDAQAALDAVGLAATTAASTAALPLTYATFQAKDSRLTSFSGLTICNGESYTLRSTQTASQTGAIYETHATDAVAFIPGASGTWYPIKDNAFTSEQIALAGATSRTGSIYAELLFWGNGAGSVPSGLTAIAAYSMNGYSTAPDDGTLDYLRFVESTISVTFINMSPTALAAAVVAAVAAKKSTLADQANFVTPPADLAQNFFNAQNWTPMDGAIPMAPDAAWIPAPADRLQIEGTLVDPEWKKAEAAISTVETDLNTGAVTATAGAPARQYITSLMDSLTVSKDDNYE
ncbi:MAG: IS30 family transposase [Luteolibacter sp.]